MVRPEKIVFSFGSVPDSSRRKIDDTPKNLRLIVMTVYILYLAGLVSGVAALIGLIIAYVNLKKTRDTWLESHIYFQLRTFWIGLIILLITMALLPFGLGFFILILFVIWVSTRSFKGIRHITKHKPISDPNTLTW